ncbi:MAG: radical SAM protein [Deltaproteobacteria bacterium]|nr:radical SAM protein [Deltaproteobacteria bacterium]
MPPSIRVLPSVEQRLASLTEAARYDLSCACGPSNSRKRGSDGLWIYPAALPNGERTAMLKVLQAKGCECACNYCSERLGGRGYQEKLAPDELAQIFMQLYQARQVFGLFLSSAIHKGAVATMDNLLATAEILRSRYKYRGYMHLKLIPGCDSAQVEYAMRYATRVSVNLETPNEAQLKKIAPGKHHAQILAIMQQVAKAEKAGRFARSGQTTQLVVGAAGESDQDIALRVANLYDDLKLSRVYYSALQPLAGVDNIIAQPVPFMREHRLYQVDFMLRCYGFKVDEIPFNDSGALSLTTDPKTLWAKQHPELFPLEINTAQRHELLRVPGIGPKSVTRLLKLRATTKLRDTQALAAVGASYKIAAPYLLFDGCRAAQQLSLF